MIKIKRFITPVLCTALLMSSQPTHCGWLLGLPLSLFSITCHTVGGLTSVAAGVFGSRAVLSGLVKASDTKKITKVAEKALNFFVKCIGEKDEAASLANWFSSGNPDSDGPAAVALLVASVVLHGTGFFSSFIAGRTTAKPQKMIHLVSDKKKNVMPQAVCSMKDLKNDD